MNELFPEQDMHMESPRLAWIKKHGVITFYSDVEPALWFAGFQDWHSDKSGIDFFVAETSANGGINIGEGDTEDLAITDLCRKCDVRLWNEEGA